MDTKRLPDSIQTLVQEAKEKLPGQLGEMFENCYTNTLNTTVKRMEDGSTYVITGDIPAMWLRDSVSQLRPYLIPAASDTELADLLVGLSHRHFQSVLIDPYANAFNEAENGNCWEKDETEMGPWIWERKYEIDSLCYPIQFAYLLWKNLGRTEQFDERFVSGVKKILTVWKLEQNHEENSDYRFIRRNSYPTDTLSRNGKGALVCSNIGLTWSGFRPSDDACTYGYLIPSNMFASVVLGYLSEIASDIYKDEDLAKEALNLGEEIHKGVETHGITKHPDYDRIYTYEADGFGQYNLMDDANVPSLLAASYLGYQPDEEAVLENTIRFILSEGNPYYYSGSKAKGIGSPHTPPRYIWPISLAIQGLNAKTKEEKLEYLNLLASTDGGKLLMHESFDPEDPAQFTRPWFSWANAMFSELALDYMGYQIKRS